MANEISTKLSADAGTIATGKHGLSLHTLQDQVEYARILLKSGFCPRGYDSPQKIVAAINYGTELGFSPIQAMQAVAMINGRPTIWGDGMLALVLRSGLVADLVESIEGEGDDAVATCQVHRKEWPSPSVRTFSWKDAERAGLTGKGPWVSYPRRMLQMRARSWCLRDVFADLLCGLQCREEVEDYPADARPRVTQSALEHELMGTEPVVVSEHEENAEWPNHVYDTPK